MATQNLDLLRSKHKNQITLRQPLQPRIQLFLNQNHKYLLMNNLQHITSHHDFLGQLS